MKVFWEVDCQNDFIQEDGALYVPNAVKLKPNLEKLTRHAIRNDILIIASRDRHWLNDIELGVFPKHCMNNSWGQVATDEVDIWHTNELVVPDKLNSWGWFYKLTYEEVVNAIKSDVKKIIFEKQHLNVFTNPNCGRIVERLSVTEVVLYGVAFEYCVLEAVKSLVTRGIKVTVVKDATEYIDPMDGLEAWEWMVNNGVEFKTTKEVLNE